MLFEFIANASGIFTGSLGTRLLCDPWLIDGVFEGSWCHYPPVSYALEDLKTIDAVYVSHIHPDHFDERTFKFIDADTPVLILKREKNFLLARLNQMGYFNIHEFEHGKTESFKEFKITMFSPFARHNFHEAEVGNIIDSAMVIQNGSLTALNANDNTPTPEACVELKKQFEKFDLVMLNYNSAGPYPSCFNNLTIDEKISEHYRILNRNFDYLCELLDVLTPRAVLPFAGAYVIGGKQSYKNRFLGTTTWDVCGREILARRPETTVCLLREGDTLDICSLETDRPYQEIDLTEQEEYIDTVLNLQKYEWESGPNPDTSKLIKDLETASAAMLIRGAKFGLVTETKVIINIEDVPVTVLPNFEKQSVLELEGEQVLFCDVDLKLLRRILDRKAHWNNAEIGCHIDFFRRPNIYEPDLHTLLQFLHL